MSNPDPASLRPPAHRPRAQRPEGPEALATQVSARRFGPLVRARKAVVDAMVRRRTRAAETKLRGHPVLWDLLIRYAQGTAVTGASYSDYWTLYQQVRLHRPREILECGTGISTVVLAQALRENAAEDGTPPGRITSMEDSEPWFAAARGRIPDELGDLIDLRHSPKVDGFYKLFRGVQYRELPDRPYDFVFSDGPDRHSPVNGDKLFNLDLIQVVRNADHPVRAVVDNHYLTFYVLQKVFGLDKAHYSIGHKLMFVGPVTRRDVRRLKKESFIQDLRLLRRTELRLRLVTDP